MGPKKKKKKKKKGGLTIDRLQLLRLGILIRSFIKVTASYSSDQQDQGHS
jgi:hypothetical protein